MQTNILVCVYARVCVYAMLLFYCVCAGVFFFLYMILHFCPLDATLDTARRSLRVQHRV